MKQFDKNNTGTNVNYSSNETLETTPLRVPPVLTPFTVVKVMTLFLGVEPAKLRASTAVKVLTASHFLPLQLH